MDSSDIRRVSDELMGLVEKLEADLDVHVESGATAHAACYGLVVGALSASGHSLEVARDALIEIEEAGA